MSKASIYFTVENELDDHDVKAIKRELDTLSGVYSVSVNASFDSIAVDFDTSGVKREQLKKQVEKLGHIVTDTRFENHIM